MKVLKRAPKQGGSQSCVPGGSIFLEQVAKRSGNLLCWVSLDCSE